MFSQWFSEFFKKTFFHGRKPDFLEVFCFTQYSVLKSTVSDDLILVTQPKGVHRYFEEVPENVFSWQKPNKIFYTGFKTIKLVKKFIIINYCLFQSSLPVHSVADTDKHERFS